MLALAAYGCSSSSSGPVPTGPCQGPGCDAGMQQDTGGSVKDAGPTEDVVGDGPHDGAAPDALYGACVLQGSFGWPCHASASGPDTTDCTDPNYGGLRRRSKRPERGGRSCATRRRCREGRRA